MLDAVMPEVEMETVGAVRSIFVSVIVPPYSEAVEYHTLVEKPTDILFAPSALCATVIEPLVEPLAAGKTFVLHTVAPLEYTVVPLIVTVVGAML